MADYIYSMETRLTPDQLRAVSLVQDIARAQEVNLYLTGGAIRDLVTGFPIRDLDFTIQANPLKLQKEFERAGARVQGVDETLKVLYLTLPQNVRAEINMARSEIYDKPGKPPVIAPATITEDLRRRDFTVNAMALSLNWGSRGLLLDPANGIADIEAKVIRILHNYAFYEEPSRLIRATRFAARFHWPLEERTQARYDAAKENHYIDFIGERAIGYEIEQLAYEEDPLHVLRALEKENWLKVLHPHWSTAKVDTTGLAHLVKTKHQMQDLGYVPDSAPAVLYFLTRKLSDRDIADIRKSIPRRDLVERWKGLDDEAKELTKRLTSKEAATPSRTWQLLSQASPDAILFVHVTARQQAVTQKITNFLVKWRQVKQKFPLPEMIELRITPTLPEYGKIAEDVFLQTLDGKLRTHTELMKYLKPLAPPPPPPPPPPRRGRGKAAEAIPQVVPPTARKKGGAATEGKAAAGKKGSAAEHQPTTETKEPETKPAKPAKSAAKPVMKAKRKPTPAAKKVAATKKASPAKKKLVKQKKGKR